MFDPNNYQSQPNLNPSHEADSWATRGGFVGWIRDMISMSFQWYIFRFLFYGTLVVVAGFFGIYSLSEKDLKESSEHLASGGLEPVAEKFLGPQFKSTKLNRHPQFLSESAKEFKETTGVAMREVYQYARIGERDVFVMKDVWFQDGKPLEIEYSNIFADDAQNYCEKHGAFVATKEEVEAASVVRRPEEGYAEPGNEDGWSGKKAFHCVIDLGGAE